ncbi:hypothetical protein Fluta_3662 [Fluviicola taffensis DSM 16823]|uniref:Uncharacterized protein n=1 Tax=Fluviicola taffensis (strain DSM 16823 / NCIMB 13979 / RW262) TaxID=755732 RepID=F2IER4_FLUTR|nr:hypothetical protein Fluta_3662 [Fluviicola taffensis DSM 16823]
MSNVKLQIMELISIRDSGIIILKSVDFWTNYELKKNGVIELEITFLYQR